MNRPLRQFDHGRGAYDRPNQKWVCGWASEGRACGPGPDGRGRCPAASQALCTPIRRGDRWHCARPEVFGGACEQGPLPDGSCCRPTPEHPICQPRLSLRAKRGRLTWACFAFTVGGLSLVLAGSWGPSFISPGPLASHHAIADTRRAGQSSCAACHTPDPQTRGFLQPVTDSACLACHDGRAHFASRSLEASHIAPSLAGGRPTAMAKDCTRCHTDHHGRDHELTRLSDALCTSCHNDLPRWARPGSLSETSRSVAGRISSFASDHPEFRFLASGEVDQTPLRFEHHVHIGSTETMRQRIDAWVAADPSHAGLGLKKDANGRVALACAACHQPDATGRHMRPISFETHCVQCHALGTKNIGGEETPIPHGSAAAMFIERAALEMVAARLQGPSSSDTTQAPADPEPSAAPSPRRGPGPRKPAASPPATPVVEISFRDRVVEETHKLNQRLGVACGLCHDPASKPGQVADPKVPAHRLTGARFNHDTHRFVDCTTCHPRAYAQPAEGVASASEPRWTGRTKELMLPGIASCRSCHASTRASPVRRDCVLCHKYHAP